MNETINGSLNEVYLWFNLCYGLLFIALLFMPMIFFGSYLYLKEPELLKKRLKSQEKEAKQRLVMDISVQFIASFVLSGLEYRYFGPG